MAVVIVLLYVHRRMPTGSKRTRANWSYSQGGPRSPSRVTLQQRSYPLSSSTLADVSCLLSMRRQSLSWSQSQLSSRCLAYSPCAAARDVMPVHAIMHLLWISATHATSTARQQAVSNDTFMQHLLSCSCTTKRIVHITSFLSRAC